MVDRILEWFLRSGFRRPSIPWCFWFYVFKNGSCATECEIRLVSCATSFEVGFDGLLLVEDEPCGGGGEDDAAAGRDGWVGCGNTLQYQWFQK